MNDIDTEKETEFDPPHIFVPDHMESKLSHPTRPLIWYINGRWKLRESIRNDILDILSAYRKACAHLSESPSEDIDRQVPPSVKSESGMDVQVKPQQLLENIGERINQQIQNMHFFFSLEEDKAHLLKFHLGPQYREQVCYWYLAQFLAGDQADWLRGPCEYCNRLIINSDTRVKYCDDKHKALYWKPHRRAYHRKYMADRRKN